MNTGSFNAYITPPIVYMIPPARSHPNADTDIELKSGLNATRHNQPINIYIVELSHFGDVTQNAVRINPHKASPHINARSGLPVDFGKASIHIGVYVPAIRK